ncbi:2-hydroxyglutaryl-CoA dehydratase, D-component [Oxobacter pfennigii]|uniref:2-hydroxyglutaryl-CoA dehydratase, D-component n=1 Tax=Oxobacter pfennigii TaxID=36849 RepID=A0A0P9AL35_9CLOT|nr:acyl-CoA dehydratase activase-related protein [Oxobacter pfennigii]KPU46049.1 2-hydroxyglutaryl-CoA dehydratase, D-component [Oxobacter pfennigii]
MKIGIPCGLLYYSFYLLWKTFFEDLGAEVVISGGTNKSILNYGVKTCVDEACLPVKIFHGHVMELRNKVDCIFIPRIVSISKNEYICPKFCGLPEMIKNSVPNLPVIIDTTIDIRRTTGTIESSLMSAARLITKDRARVMRAYYNALLRHRVFEENLKSTGDFERSLDKLNIKTKDNRRKIGILGHPYNIYDDFANMGIRNKLIFQGFMPITPEMVNEDKINLNASKMPKRHFWTFGRKILGTGLTFLEEKNVDGIIYLSSFGCGIDSLMEDYIERYIRRERSIPYMKITLDEHSGEAGVDTRLEAFMDMVKWREDYESNISPYGGSICGNKRFS